ncbi:NADH:ubiquinone reductase (Na(+)-transporting) subunit B [Ferrimonas aestuarii]|uniref:Na(+)-translocating NADH-quinone reductase subunit B n=1 Tax=Ferrimonas aestuarii TaxID=2569539 RepID=A0A4U1BQE5_9GAMM|nr:NADH:ubiquinone reductase (Na(+)-transporting) subunit B [Ferrimonas aestuarii]TKB56542.1 NADH:ubiquinone reductase (Na(+)-transporting) subunit B [Ferrimonas aestuarii]
MSKQSNKRQDAYYEPGNSLRDYIRSLFIRFGRSTSGKVHVRDAIDVQRTMMLVMLALMPATLFGLYNVGYQAQLAVISGLSTPDVWQLMPFNALVGGLTADSGLLSLMAYGASFFLPIYLVAMLTNLAWEVVFARVRGSELQEGFMVTSLLLALILPVSIPLWMVAVAISFGVVMAKEIFGGLGYNFLNPALAALAFIYFAYPGEFESAATLVAVDGFTGATTLAQTAAGKLSWDAGALAAFSDGAWWDAFLGFTPGAIGETSTLAILIGGAYLILTRLVDWRIVTAVFFGMVATSMLFNVIGSETNAMFAMPWTWHLVTGGFAIGMMFMATDPVTTAYTRKGKWAFGLMIGAMTVMIRVVNAKMPEGIMLAILFANLWAPLFDHLVMRANIKRRLARS